MFVTNSAIQSSAPSPYWLRHIRVTLGPLEEWRGAQSGSTLCFEADGTPRGFGISARVNKTIMGIPQPSSVTIYNLSRNTRNVIKDNLTKITVEVGWKETELHILFQGSVISVQTTPGSPDVPTTITAIPGYGSMARGISSRTYTQGSTVKSIIADLVRDLPGLGTSTPAIIGVEASLGPAGWSFAGNTTDGLTKLAEEFGFSWHVDNGFFKAISDDATFGQPVVLNGGNGGLINVNPILTGTYEEQTGVKIKAFYMPEVTSGSNVVVKSDFSPEYNGSYRVHSAHINVSSHGGEWTMDLEAFPAR